MEIIIKTLELLFSAFSFLTGYRLTRTGKAQVKKTALVCAAVMSTYWAVFLPVLLIKRRLGLSDIGRVTILWEALCFGTDTLPFAGFVGGLVLSLLLMLLLTRVPRVHPLFSIWLMVVMPVTAAGTIAYYAPMQPKLVTALSNLQLAICCVGAGCALASWPKAGWNASKPVRAALCALALTGHYVLPQITLGALQLVGNRISFTFDMDALYLTAVFLAVRGTQVTACLMEDVQESAPYFDRRITSAIKGVCIVMMFGHHFFTFPEWYVQGVSYPALAGFAQVFRLPLSICVPVFAFITGYFYAFSRKKTLRGSLEKIAGVMVVYWLIQVLLYALAAAGGAKLDAGTFLWEMIGLENAVVTFNWYIAFYIMAMLMLPLLTRLPQRGACVSSLIVIGLPVLAATAVRALAPYGSHVATAAQYMLDGVTGLGAGYVVARFGFYEKLDGILGGRRFVRGAACVGFGLMAFLGRYYAPRLVVPLPGLAESWALRISMDVLYAPIVVYTLANLLPLLPGACLRMLSELGKYSLHMWLISCVFFNAGKAVYQPLLYLPKQPLLVLLWGLMVCYAAARLVDVILSALNRIAKGKKFS